MKALGVLLILAAIVLFALNGFRLPGESHVSCWPGSPAANSKACVGSGPTQTTTSTTEDEGAELLNPDSPLHKRLMKAAKTRAEEGYPAAGSVQEAREELDAQAQKEEAEHATAGEERLKEAVQAERGK
jgi:hypothetical protein